MQTIQLGACGQLRLLRTSEHRGSQPRVHARLLKGRARPGGNLCGPVSRRKLTGCWRCSTTLTWLAQRAACIARSMEDGLQLPQTSCPQTLTLSTLPSPFPGVDYRLAMLAMQKS
ncbi:hypothetical protein SVAN01_08362 [Stagonosporopsis vannaccii]|nr:hypothetical protein SVAN01_08362 [Stagonosporopsis vannaccii]